VTELARDQLGRLLRQRGGTRSVGSPAVRLRAALRLRLAGAAERLRRDPAGLACALAGLPEGLAHPADDLTEVACGLPGALADIADGLPSAVAYITDRLPGALTDVAHGLPGALTDITGRLAGALAHVLERRLRAVTDVLRGVAGLVHRLSGALADVRHGPAEPLHKLRVAIQARHQAIDDRRHVVEAGLEDQLRLDALDGELGLAEVHVDAHVELDEVQHLRLEGDVRVEVVELEVDRVDPELRYVEKDVRRSDAVLLLPVLVPTVFAVGVVLLEQRLLHRARAVAATTAAAPGARGLLPVARGRA
jgi:hypothetical protein